METFSTSKVSCPKGPDKSSGCWGLFLAVMNPKWREASWSSAVISHAAFTTWRATASDSPLHNKYHSYHAGEKTTVLKSIWAQIFAGCVLSTEGNKASWPITLRFLSVKMWICILVARIWLGRKNGLLLCSDRWLQSKSALYWLRNDMASNHQKPYKHLTHEMEWNKSQ